MKRQIALLKSLLAASFLVSCATPTRPDVDFCVVLRSGGASCISWEPGKRVDRDIKKEDLPGGMWMSIQDFVSLKQYIRNIESEKGLPHSRERWESNPCEVLPEPLVHSGSVLDSQ